MVSPTATSLSFNEQSLAKQKESSPCIIFILCSSLQSNALFKAKLSPSFQARLRNSLRSNSARRHRLSTALLGEDEGIEKRNLEYRECETFLPQNDFVATRRLSSTYTTGYLFIGNGTQQNVRQSEPKISQTVLALFLPIFITL